MSIFGDISGSVPRKNERRKKRHGPTGRRTVGRRGAGDVNLTHGVRRQLHRQARRRSRAQNHPDVVAARQQVKSLRRQRRAEVRSVEGAGDQAAAAIQAALRGLKQSGLRGAYLHDAAQELAARRADVPQSVSLLKSDVRQQYQEPISSARQAIYDARANQQQQAASMYVSLLEKAKTQARSTLDERRSRAEEKRGNRQDRAQEVADKRKGIKTAVHTGARLLIAYPGQEPSNNKEWARFELALAAKEGVDAQTARHAVEVLKRRLAKTEIGLGDRPYAHGTARVIGG